MGVLYARHAWTAYSNKNWTEFKNLTEKGSEFDSENPDLLSFRGFLCQEERNYNGAALFYDKAYHQKKDTGYFSRMDLLASLAAIHYRLGDYQAQIDLYRKVGGLNRDDPDFLFYTVLCFDKTGNESEAVMLAEEGLYRFKDQRFLILLSSWQEDTRYPSMLNDFLDRQGLQYPDLLARVVLRNTRDEDPLSYQYISRIRDLNSWYLSRYRLNAAEAPGPVPAVKSGRIWLSEVITSVWESSGPGSLLNRMEGDTLRLDCSGDGVADWEIRKMGNGFLWEKDENQDGSIDFQISWSSEFIPESIQYNENNYSVYCDYYEYPHVQSIRITGPDRSDREYLYLPGSYELSINGEAQLSWVDAVCLSYSTLPSWMRGGEADYLKFCYSLKDLVTVKNSMLFREYTVVNGTISRFREDSNFDGHFDRMVLLKNWFPFEGYRDLDLDGCYDIREIYSMGRLISLKIQGDHSFIEEYFDLWNSKRYQLWNFDKTSFYDAVLVQNSDLSWDEKGLDPFTFMLSDIKK